MKKIRTYNVGGLLLESIEIEYLHESSRQDIASMCDKCDIKIVLLYCQGFRVVSMVFARKIKLFYGLIFINFSCILPLLFRSALEGLIIYLFVVLLLWHYLLIARCFCIQRSQSTV